MEKNQQWKSKVQELFQVAQDELKRTTEIGKKMLTASKTNSSLHEAYEELGMLAAKAIENGTLNWNNERVKDLLAEIANCEKDLEVIESEVKKIKFSAGPMDIGTAGPVATDSSESEKKTETEEVKVKEDKKSEDSES